MMNKLLKADFTIFFTPIMLISIGLLTLYSMTLTNDAIRKEYLEVEFTNQLIYAFIGLLTGFLIFLIPLHYFRISWILFGVYVITLLMLLYTLVFGLEINGVKRWINIGGYVLDDGTIAGGITIQASEFAKLTLILIVSYILSLSIKSAEKKVFLINKIKQFLLQNKNRFYALIFGTIIIVLIFMQKSLSVVITTTLIFFSLFFANIRHKGQFLFIMTTFILSLIASQSIVPIQDYLKLLIMLILVALYLFNLKFKFTKQLNLFVALIVGIISGGVLLNLFWNNLLQDYQRQRVETFLNPNKNIQDEGYQQYQSILSIGSGQIFGQGFFQTTDERIILLPEPTTDFIFAIFSYKFGFIGGIFLLSLYMILVTRLYYLSDIMNDKYSSLVLIGIASMIMIQCFQNIGMNMGLLPVGGTTLPFVSAGGSSLIAMMIAIGLAENIIASNQLEKTIHQRYDKILIEGWNI